MFDSSFDSTFHSTFDSAFDSTLDYLDNNATIYDTEEMISMDSEIEWYELWNADWWVINEWSPLNWLIVIIILVLIIIVCVGIICICRKCGVCIKCNNKSKMNSYSSSDHNQSPAKIQRKPSKDSHGQYNTIEQGTDDDLSENETMATAATTTNVNVNIDFDKGKNMRPNSEQIELKKNVNDIAPDLCLDKSDHSSEELFGPGPEDNTYPETPMGTAGAVNYTMTPGSNPQDHQTVISTGSTPTTYTRGSMDINSMRAGMNAAEMTKGNPFNHNQYEYEYNDNDNKSALSINMMPINQRSSHSNMSPIMTRAISDEGIDWDEWLKNALKQCFPDNWRQYLTKFKEHRITEDVLITMNTDIHNKGEVWKELLPAIGDRMRFQKVWNDELMRRQLTKK